jgi:hypothetical protein
LLALMDAGVVCADFGPGANCVLDEHTGRFVVRSHWSSETATADVLVRGRASLPGPREDKSPLMRKMMQRGIVTPFMNGGFHPGGISVDRSMNVVGRDGAAQPSLWALGTLVEGCKFYTFVLPRPGANSTTMVDAGRAVGRMMDAIGERSARLRLLQAADEQETRSAEAEMFTYMLDASAEPEPQQVPPPSPLALAGA